MGLYRPNKILRFHSSKPPNQKVKTRQKKKPNLHPIVRKRRLLYLAWMVIFLFWFIIEMIIQQGRIWDREEKLANKQEELVSAQEESNQLKEDIQLLKSPDYLIELAHKLGYSKPEEDHYQIQKE